MSSTPNSPTATRSNYLFAGGTTKSFASSQVFVGTQRERAQAMLATAIAERRVLTVMQLVAKDPSLTLDRVAPPTKLGDIEAPKDFAEACLSNDITPGVICAINHGYDPSLLLGPALNKMAATGASAEADLGLLLAMGADPNRTAATVDDPGILARAMTLAYPPETSTGKAQYPGLVTMLLDAKAVPVWPSEINSALCTMVLTAGWQDPGKAAELTKQMARLVKAGAPLDTRCGSMRMSPLDLALGKKLPLAVIGLVRLGCDVDPRARVSNKDLMEQFDSLKLIEYKPLLQDALMERRINQVKKEAEAAAGAGAETAESEQHAGRRRRGPI